MNITLNYKYIQHDIDQWTYRLAKMRIDDDNSRNEAQSSSVSTDVSYYRRKITESIANLRTMLKNRLATKNGTGNDALDVNATAWTISLTDGAYYCDAQALADLMHKYVVRNTMTEWAMTYAPEAAQSISQEADMVRQQILSEVYTRKYPDLTDNATTTTLYTVTLASNNTTYGTVTGGGSYLGGTQISIKATPSDASLYKFVKWDDDVTDSTRQVTVTGNKTYTATFATL